MIVVIVLLVGVEDGQLLGRYSAALKTKDTAPFLRIAVRSDAAQIN